MNFSRHVQTFAALAVLGLGLAVGEAQVVPGTDFEQTGLGDSFLLRVWDTADGLLPTTIHCLTQTLDGYVWLASSDGLVRFDGSRVRTFRSLDVPELAGRLRVQRTYSDRAGRLWVTTMDGALIVQENNQWRSFPATDGWDSQAVDSIAESTDGTLLFAGHTNVVRYAKGRLSKVELPELPADFRPPMEVISDPAGEIWLVSRSHVWRQDVAGWTEIATPKSLGGVIVGAGPGRDKGVWIATSKRLRKFVEPKPSITRDRPDGTTADPVRLLEDFRGNLWIGGATTGLKVWMHDGKMLDASRKDESLEAQITWLFEDRERNILVGTAGGGLGRFKPRSFRVHLARLGGLLGTLVNTVCEESPGVMLVGTEGSGLHRISASDMNERVIARDGGLSARNRVSSLLRLRDGTILAAVAASGLYQINDRDATRLDVPSLGKDLVRVMFEDNQGRVWIGHDRGVTVRESGSFRSFPASDKKPLTNVKAITQDRDGAIWLISGEGLARVNGSQIQPVKLEGLPTKANLLALNADGDGALWIAVENCGLILLRRDSQAWFSTTNGLPFLSIGAIVSEDSHVWLAGENGIARVARKSFDAVSAGKAQRLDLQLFNRADGLPSDATRRGYQPAATRDSAGIIWFATHKGIVAVDPTEIASSTYEAPPVIEEVRADLDLIEVTPDNAEHITIPAGTRHITVRCATPTLGKPEYTRFEYRLDGLDDRWIDAANDHVVRLYDLGPGKYRFRVRAYGTDGRLIQPHTSIGLVVIPFYWQTTWFRGVVVAGLMALAGWGVWRAQQVRIVRRDTLLAQQEEHSILEAQLQQARKMESVGRLAGGIAHDFNNLLTIIMGNIQLLRFEHKGDTAKQRNLDDMDMAAGRARDLVNQILTYSRQHKTERVVVDLAPHFAETCRLIRSGIPATVAIDLTIPGSLPPVLADVAQVQRIIMNLSSNAAQALPSSGGRIAIVAREEIVPVGSRARPEIQPGRYLMLSVSDNGHGMDHQIQGRIFDPFFTTKEVGKGTGLGLSVVHGIVESHDGSIAVRSTPQKGTKFEVYFPVAAGEAPPQTPPQQDIKPGFKQTILLVDDEPSVLNIEGRILEKLGYTVDREPDPLSALDRMTTNKGGYQLVITDFAMPEMDGFEFARLIWQIRPGMPIILCTGYGGSITPENARELGFACLVSKPFDVRAISEAVSTTLKAAGPKT